MMMMMMMSLQFTYNVGKFFNCLQLKFLYVAVLYPATSAKVHLTNCYIGPF
jgi:hypothetical protein